MEIYAKLVNKIIIEMKMEDVLIQKDVKYHIMENVLNVKKAIF